MDLERRAHSRRPRAAAAARSPSSRDRPLERQRQRLRAEEHAVRVHLDLVLLAPVVEPGLDSISKLHRAAHDHDAPQQPVAVQSRLVLDRHEVLHLARRRRA
jgi:hypothetical protein